MKSAEKGLGGFQSKHGHASLMIPGPVAAMDVEQFFSPVKGKTRNHDDADSGGKFATL